MGPAVQKTLHAFRQIAPVADRARRIVARADRAAGREDAGGAGLESDGIDTDHAFRGLDSEPGGVGLLHVADGEDHRVKLPAQFREADVAAEPRVQAELETKALDDFDFAVEHGARQLGLPHPVAHVAAGFGVIVNADAAVPGLHQEKCGAQPGRTRPDNSDAFIGRRIAGRHERVGGILVGDFAFDQLDRDRPVVFRAAAAGLARSAADPAHHAGEHDIFFHERDRLAHFSFGDEPDRGGDLEASRADALAEGNAVAEVVAEQELQRRLARRLHFGRLAGDGHSLGDFCRARRRQSRVAVNPHNARHARGMVFLHAGEVAERRDVQTELPRGVEDRAAGRHGDGAVVDGERDGAIHVWTAVRAAVRGASGRGISLRRS